MMDKVSVGATVTIMSAATLAEGTTVIETPLASGNRRYGELPQHAGREIKGQGTDASPSKA